MSTTFTYSPSSGMTPDEWQQGVNAWNAWLTDCNKGPSNWADEDEEDIPGSPTSSGADTLVAWEEEEDKVEAKVPAHHITPVLLPPTPAWQPALETIIECEEPQFVSMPTAPEVVMPSPSPVLALTNPPHSSLSNLNYYEIVSLILFGFSLDFGLIIILALLTCCFFLYRMELQDQVVLITGGGSGIGKLLAETLASRKVTTVVLSNSPVAVDPIHVDHLFPYDCDVSNYSNVEAVAERIRQEIGHPTIIINNAGVVKGKLLLDLTEADVLNTFGSNVLAHFWVLKCFLPALIRSGKGHIITVSSLLGLIGCAQMTDYCASKAAVINLHQSLRFELDNRYMSPNIKTTLLLPSFITTTLFSRIQMPRSRLFDFLAPPLHPSDVVQAIISALDANESRVIRMPFYTQAARIWSVGVGFVPKRLVDLVQWLSGADHAMSEYGPKPDAAERLLEEKRLLEKTE